VAEFGTCGQLQRLTPVSVHLSATIDVELESWNLSLFVDGLDGLASTKDWRPAPIGDRKRHRLFSIS
jgi:hypothetical protein